MCWLCPPLPLPRPPGFRGPLGGSRVKVGSGIAGVGSGIGSECSKGVKSSSNRSSGGRVWANSSMEGSYAGVSLGALAENHEDVFLSFYLASITRRYKSISPLTGMIFSNCGSGSSGAGAGAGAGSGSAGAAFAHFEACMVVIIS